MVRKALTATAAVISCVAMLAGGVVASATETVPAQGWSDTVRGGDSILATPGDGSADGAGTAGGSGSVTGTDDPSAQTPGADSSASGGQTSQSDNPSDDSVDTSGASAGSDGTSPSDSDAGSAGTLIGGLGGTDGTREEHDNSDSDTAEGNSSPSAGDAKAQGDISTLAIADDCPSGVTNEALGCTRRNDLSSRLVNEPRLRTALDTQQANGISPSGTTIDLFDYWLTTRDSEDMKREFALQGQADKNRAPCPGDNCANSLGINQHSVLKFFVQGNQVSNNASGQLNGYRKNPTTGIVKSTLGEDGYPHLSNTWTSGYGTRSLSYLFNQSAQAGKASYHDVRNLLQMDGDGYFYYDSMKNFASFDEKSNSFVLYDRSSVRNWQVDAGYTGDDRGLKKNMNGQFFPFNKGYEVFDADGNGDLTVRRTPIGEVHSRWSILNHYFCMTMSTRFMQPTDGLVARGDNSGRSGTGKPADSRPMTYNFSGDDDVWVYIDGVLVGDLGGIHDRTCLQIDFSTGRVYVYQDNVNTGTLNVYDPGADILVRETTIKRCFDTAGKTTDVQWRGDTFADNTDHTLDFFYLERGNSDSNMSLKSNLVSVPASRVEKTDQDGEPMPNVKFTMSPAKGATGQKDENGRDIVDWSVDTSRKGYAGSTGTDGTLTFRVREGEPGAGTPVSLDHVHHESQYWVLSEEGQSGYRIPRDAHLYFENPCTGKDGTPLGLGQTCPTNWLLSANQWESDAYATGQVRTTIPQSTTKLGVWDPDGADPMATTSIDYTPGQGTVFAVVMTYTGDPDDPSDVMRTENWTPITGTLQEGWTIASDSDGTDWPKILDFAKRAGLVFTTASSGGMYVDVNDLPGDITTYYYTLKEKYGTVQGLPIDELAPAIAKELGYTIAYFYSAAPSIDRVTTTGNYRMMRITQGSSDLFQREFSTTLRVANMHNELKLVKTNDSGKPLKGATFTLYRDGDDVNAPNGTFTADEIVARDLTTDTDGTLDISQQGELRNGSYLLAETGAPTGYATNEAATVVTDNRGTVTGGGIRFVVDGDGVRVDAGRPGDGVTVRMGVGRLAYSLRGFATADDVDSTLHDVIARPMRAGDYRGPDGTAWTEAATADGKESGQFDRHVTYTADPDGEYAPAVDKDTRKVVPQDGWNDEWDGTVQDTYPYYAGEPPYTWREEDTGWNKLVITQDFHARHDSASGHEAAKHDIGDVDLNRLFTDDVTIYVADPRETGAMEVSKQVQGVGGDVTRFSFDLTAWSDDELLSERYGQQGRTFPATLYATGGTRPQDATGTVSFACTTGGGDGTSSCTGTYAPNNATPVTGNPAFTLKDNQTLLIDGLPVGTKVTVTEHDYMPKGYATTVTIGSTTAVSRTTDDLKGTGNKSLAVIPEPKDGKGSPLTIAFTNRYIRVASLPFTGGPWTAAWLILAGTGLLGLACAAHRLARRRQTHARI